MWKKINFGNNKSVQKLYVREDKLINIFTNLVVMLQLWTQSVIIDRICRKIGLNIGTPESVYAPSQLAKVVPAAGGGRKKRRKRKYKK